MHILPSLEEVRKVAAAGTYKVLPVSCEILADICTPIEAIKILKNVSSHCYMLESVAEHEKWGRYTFLGFDPKLEITCIDGEMKVGSVLFKTDSPSAVLRQILAEYRSPRFPYLPSFTGGWSAISPMIISDTANRLSVPAPRIPRASRTWI